MAAKPLREITTEEIDAFHRDGAVLIKAVLADEWVAMIREGLDFADEHPDGMSAGVKLALRIDQFPAARSAKLREAIDCSPIAEIVGTTLRSPVRFYMDQMFIKPEGELVPTPWHQDTCYYNVEGHDLIRAWVCVDPVPREASLEVVRGSHRWNVTYRSLAGRDPATDPDGAKQAEAAAAAGEPVIGSDSHDTWSYSDGFFDTRLPMTPDIATYRDSYDIIGWDYEPGDVILFHGNILHGARGGVNLMHPRRSHASMWAGRDVRYVHRPGQIVPDPLALYDCKPKSGQPLGDFPDVFPLAWSP
jgi:ectoine hydroxylase-related dioxygenase (phytanoyl-CoA dioxygenase family)